MPDISHDQQHHRFTTRIEGHDAYLEYELSGDDMAITHTRVPPAIGGRGVAAQLMQAALAAAKDNHWNVVPVCSYAVAYMKRHPSDEQHREDLLDEALEESFPASDSPAVGGAD
jgi:predicted GNAT family acetyltransferase